MTLKLAVFLIFAIGSTLGDLPPCFTNSSTWHSDDVTDVITNVHNVYQCQESCEMANCTGFTYYTQHNQHFPLACFLFHSLSSREESCQDCISGPDSCTCSASYSCDLTPDNTIDVIPSTQSETQCQNICFNTPGCQFYTYFNEENVMEGICYIFSSCPQMDEDCVGCLTGPPVCTSTTPKPTTTTTPQPTTTSINPICDYTPYKNLSDRTRSVYYQNNEGYCDMGGYTEPRIVSPDWQGPGWYRISGEAGNQLPENPPGDHSSCGTSLPGWLDGEHPQVLDGEVSRWVCFSNADNYSCIYHVTISIINCGSFYLYNLPNTPECMLRYCGI